MMRASVAWSSDEVASSRMMMGALRSRVRAMQMRCACPSEKPPPRSLVGVSRPRGSAKTKSAHASVSALLSSSSLALGEAISRFSRSVPLRSVLPWGRYAKYERVSALNGVLALLS